MARMQIIEIEPCDRCGRPHRTRYGKPSCPHHLSKRGPSGELVPCARSITEGLDICMMHAGNTEKSRQKAMRIKAENDGRKALERVVRVFGIERQVDPHDGIIESYWRSAGILRALEGLVSEINPNDYGWGLLLERTEREETELPKGYELPPGMPLAQSVKKITTHGAREHILLKMFNAERDRFERLGIEIIKLGLEARRDEQLATQIDLLMTVLAPARLTEAQRRIIAEGLRALGGMTPAATAALANEHPILTAELLDDLPAMPA